MTSNYLTTQHVSSTSTNTNAGTGVTKTVSNPGAPTNINTVASNPTTAYFNNFFVNPTTVSSNVNDEIVSFFEKQTGDSQSAQLLAAAVINTATQQKEDPAQVMDQFRKMGPGELNVYLALYLNLSRVNSSLLGVRNSPQTSKYVQRSIIS
jgi:hypothetical protein